MSRQNIGRRGYTLMELVVSMTSATLLMTGLASALVIATSAFNLDSGKQSKTATAARVQADLMADLQHALSFSERTATAVTFTVPDRDDNGLPETIRYSWSGTPGDPLMYAYNGATAVSLADDVQSFDLSYLTRTMGPSGCSPPVFEEFTEAKRDSGGTTISIDTPPDTTEGDLLIAAVATDGNTDNALSAPAGWTLIAIDAKNNKVTLGVWWKLAEASEPPSHTFDWSGASNQESYGWIMRFVGHDPDDPINALSVLTSGNDSTPTSPAVSTTVENTLILRLGGFDDDDVTVDVTGLADHTSITMDESGSGGGTVSGGAGYEVHESTGYSGNSSFALNANEQSVTITVAIAGAACGASGGSLAGPVFEQLTEAKLSSNGTSITVNTPSGTSAGDLLIAAVATDKETEAVLTAPAGWNLIALDQYDDDVTLGVWWKLAGASEPATHQFTWPAVNEQSYAWIMRFTNHDPANPINASAVSSNSNGSSPHSPAVTTTIDDALILRLGGFDDDDISVDVPGLAGHAVITMDENKSGNGTVSGGAGYTIQGTAGSSGSSNFSLNANEQSVTVTIAIAPAP